MDWYFKILKKYIDFKGRASREEFWMFFGFNSVILAVLKNIELRTGIGIVESLPTHLNFGLLSMIFLVLIALPSISVLVRRLQDANCNGRWFFITLIPYIGLIWVLLLAAKKGNSTENQYGNPVAFE